MLRAPTAYFWCSCREAKSRCHPETVNPVCAIHTARPSRQEDHQAAPSEASPSITRKALIMMIDRYNSRGFSHDSTGAYCPRAISLLLVWKILHSITTHFIYKSRRRAESLKSCEIPSKKFLLFLAGMIEADRRDCTVKVTSQIMSILRERGHQLTRPAQPAGHPVLFCGPVESELKTFCILPL